MANLTLMIGNRSYDLYCADGDEDNLQALAKLVDTKAEQARQIVGDLNETRQLLFAALFLADELMNQRTSATDSVRSADSDSLAALDRIAERLERLADSI